MKYFLLVFLAVCLGNSSCTSTPNQQYATEPVYEQPSGYPQNTVVVHDNDHSDLATGILLGHALSNSGGGGGYNSGYSKSKKVKKTTIINNYHAPTVTRRVGSTRTGNSYSAPKSSYRASTSMGSRSRRGR